jgi:hypothetical protein
MHREFSLGNLLQNVHLKDRRSLEDNITMDLSKTSCKD